ncbi:MAG: hypothetical protein V4654_09480 [Bdellovibrionota bacterium]
MAFLKNLIKTCIFSFLMTAGFQAEAADKCASADKSKYLKVGSFDSAPGERIIRFKQLRDDLKSALEKGEADRSQCLYELYDKSAQDEAGFWQAKAAAEGCDLENPKECPDPETPRSLKFLENIHKELEADLKEDIAQLPTTTEAAAECTEGCGEAVAAVDTDMADQVALAEYLQHDQCCGAKDAKTDGEMGFVRERYPGITYNQCLAKTDKNHKASGMQTAGSCIAGLVTSVFKGMFDGVVGFFKLPGELVAARAQIWAIITDKDERAKFFEHIKNSVLEFIGVQGGDLTNCLNAEAKTKYYCENAGEVIGFLASPALIGNIFKIAKLGVKAAAASMKTALKSTAKGAKMLARMSQAVKATEAVAGKGKAFARKKVATGALIVGMTMQTSKIAKLIVKAGSPFARGAAEALKLLSPVVTAAKVTGKVLALPSKITNKAIIAGFSAGQKVVANIAAKRGGQVITASAVAAPVVVAPAAGVSGAVDDAAAAAATSARGAPLEPVTPTSMSGKSTTIPVSGKTGSGDAAGGNARTYSYTTTPAQQPPVQVLPRVQPTTANPTGNPYVGTPTRNLGVNLARTNSQLARVEAQLAAKPTDAALLQTQSDLLARKQLLDEALAPKPASPTPVEKVRDGSVQLFQGTPKEVATTPQVKAAERNIQTRSKRGGQAEAKSYIAGERERLNGLLSKYDQELNVVKGEAASVRPAKEKVIQDKIRDARQRLDAIEQAERNLQYRQWEAQDAG